MRNTIHTLFSTTRFLSKHLILLTYAPCIPAYPSPQNPTCINFSLQNRHYNGKLPIPEIESATYSMLENKLKSIGIDNLANCKIGDRNRLICPQCAGGDSMERTFSLYITPDANLAMWQCYRAKCGWRGHVRAFENDKAGFSKLDEDANVKRTRIITRKGVGLELLCNEDQRSGESKSSKTFYESHTECHQPVETREVDTLESATYVILEKKLKAIGIDSANCNIGERSRLICPKCEGGHSMEKRFSLYITPDANRAMWQCYQAKCGWRGHVWGFENDKVGLSKFGENANVKRSRIITEESIGLEPLCSEIVAYFAERMISGDTLRRNGVMQKIRSEKVAIAFPYKRNGVLVSCKYRELDHKIFWQEKETEKILYGVDDIRDTGDIIIVEGEIDKLSMEEAGFPNCVSVPSGAPCKISKTVPSEEKDKKFQYLWNCKEYWGKASRIILATDADKPGQALAEELARRLGRERCWRVKWPKRSRNEVCKDANEVLMHLGPGALHEVINQAEIYPIRCAQIQ